MKKEDDKEFYAVTGGIGALGVVVEVVLQCVSLFNLEKEINIVKIAQVERGMFVFFSLLKLKLITVMKTLRQYLTTTTM